MGLTKSQRLVKEAIERLTSDEDRQQDLWLAYLSGNPELSTTLSSLLLNEEIYEASKLQAQQLISSPISDEIDLNLTENERVILYLLMAGYDHDKISMYNSVSKVRINQILVSLRGSSLLKSFQ